MKPKNKQTRNGETDSFLLREVVHRAIDALVIGKASLGAAMPALLAAGEATCPSRLWKPLKSFRWESALAPTLRAFQSALKKEKPPRNLRALFFSAPETFFLQTEIGWCGMGRFDADDSKHEYVSKTLDWPHNVPSLRISALHRAYRAAERMSFSFDDDGYYDHPALHIPLFAVAMGMTCFLACELAVRVDPRVLGAHARPIGISAGPVAGESHFLGTVSRKGWIPDPRCWLASRDPNFERQE